MLRSWRAALPAWVGLTLCTGLLCAQDQDTSAPAAAAIVSQATALPAAIAALAASPGVERAHWGVIVTQLDGTPVYSLNAGQLFRPASTAKLFTTAAAMSLLGADATTAATLSFATPLADGTVVGDLLISGGNDPDLAGEEPPWTPHAVALPGAASAAPAQDPLHSLEAFVPELTARGVHRITGNIVATTAWDPYPQGWAAEDLLWGYGAPVTAIGLNDNQLLLTVTGGTAPSSPATVRLSPDTGFYSLQGSVFTASAAALPEVTVHHDPGDGALRLSGSVGAGRVFKTEIAVDDPPLFVARALRDALQATGVSVSGTAVARHVEPADVSFLYQSRQPLQLPKLPSSPGAMPDAGPGQVTLRHTSRTLAQDVLPTLKESLNLHAELMLRRLGSLAGEQSGVAGARVVHQWLKDIGFAEHEVLLYDGSGLSTKDLVTPHAEAELLAYAAGQPWFDRWKTSLPVGGIDGTLASRFTTAPLKGHLLAKTGTLGESRALAGYLHCASGKELIVVLLVDNHEAGSQADRQVMDSMVATIAAAN